MIHPRGIYAGRLRTLRIMAGALAARREHCFLCFEVLSKHLTGSSLHPIQSQLESDGASSGKYPLFVTWMKGGKLRGCIGTFSPEPLISGLQEYALTSALRDNPLHSDHLRRAAATGVRGLPSAFLRAVPGPV
jgi:AMMECR1 domain-containing protein